MGKTKEVECVEYPQGMNPDDYKLWNYLSTPRGVDRLFHYMRSRGIVRTYTTAKSKLMIWKERGWVGFTRNRMVISEVYRICNNTVATKTINTREDKI